MRTAQQHCTFKFQCSFFLPSHYQKGFENISATLRVSKKVENSTLDSTLGAAYGLIVGLGLDRIRIRNPDMSACQSQNQGKTYQL